MEKSENYLDWATRSSFQQSLDHIQYSLPEVCLESSGSGNIFIVAAVFGTALCGRSLLVYGK